MPARVGKVDRAEVARRVLAYLERQIAWFESALERFESGKEDAVAQSPEALLEVMDADTRELETFSREQRALLRDWRAVADEAPEGVRAAIRERAQHSESLALRLRVAREASLLRVEQMLSMTRKEQSNLRRERALLGRYSAGGGPGAFLNEEV